MAPKTTTTAGSFSTPWPRTTSGTDRRTSPFFATNVRNCSHVFPSAFPQTTARGNLIRLMDLPGQWINHARRRRVLAKIVLDMDSYVGKTYGQQQASAYNGHFGCTCYHPLFVFNQFGDLERVMLRRGNHHSAKFWRRVLLPVIARYCELKIPKFFRGDAAFATPKLFRVLEQEGYRYAIRPKANSILERHIAHLLKRPVGRPLEEAEGLLSRLPVSGEVVGPRPTGRLIMWAICRSRTALAFSRIAYQ